MEVYYTDKELRDLREAIRELNTFKQREKIFRSSQMKEDQKIARKIARRAEETYSDYNYRYLDVDEVADYAEEFVAYYYALTLITLDNIAMDSYAEVATFTFADLLHEEDRQTLTDSIQLGIHIIALLKEAGFAKGISDDIDTFQPMIDALMEMHNALRSMPDFLLDDWLMEDFYEKLDESTMSDELTEAEYQEMLLSTPPAVLNHANAKALIAEFEITDPKEQFVIFSSFARIIDNITNPSPYYSPLDILKQEYTSIFVLQRGFELAAQRLLIAMKFLESWMKLPHLSLDVPLKDLVKDFNQSMEKLMLSYNLEHNTKEVTPLVISYKAYGKSRIVLKTEKKEALSLYLKNREEVYERKDLEQFQTKSIRKRNFVPQTAEKHQLLVERYLAEALPNYHDNKMEDRVKVILPIFIFEWYAKYKLPVSQMTGNSFAEHILEEFASKERYPIMDYMSIFTTIIGYVAWLADTGIVQEHIASAVINKVNDVEDMANQIRARLVFESKD